MAEVLIDTPRRSRAHSAIAQVELLTIVSVDVRGVVASYYRGLGKASQSELGG
jgi:hypothetical protein